jgi:glucan phosphoethanolaminetransferase (alkaline phosphatase superfamily)
MQNTLSVMDTSGDTEYWWDVDNEDEIDIARTVFKKFKKKNYLAYKIKSNGNKGELIKTFDENAGKIILMPPVVGG